MADVVSIGGPIVVIIYVIVIRIRRVRIGPVDVTFFNQRASA